MKFRAIRTLLGIVLAATAISTTPAQAQTAQAADSASMVKPPPDAANTRPDKVDNMPTKRPALPANSNRMLHNNPASDAIAK